MDKGPRPGQALRVLAASGQLGNGIPEAALKAGLAREPHVLGCDMGSIDVGPAYLGGGRLATSPAITKRDLRLVILGARQAGVPLLIGSAGTAGAAPHLDQTLAMIRAIAKEDGLKLRIAVIAADMDRAWLRAMAQAGRVQPIGAIGALEAGTIDGAAHIVGQMGTEAFLRALAMEPDIVLAGRACDTAVFAAVPLMLGYAPGPATHMAKIIECTSLCCVPGGRDAMLGTLTGESFELESMNPARAATPVSVAAHSLYEQADPLRVHEPEGMMDTTEAVYAAIDDRRVRVSGATWVPARQHSIKVEGATHVGERAVLLASTTDPRVIEQRDSIAAGVRRIVADILPGAGDYELRFRAYGTGETNLFPGAREGLPVPAEVFFLLECIAGDADTAKAIIGVAKQNLLHFGFPGRLSTGGNIAFPFTPPELPAGSAYRYSIYHVAECDDLAGAFPVRMEEAG
ncbi:acyclic terpene utilization AtuA family protein [Falsiroseomonas ponticola]|uniref:acyclic terpene utilization AtuA family protein n=1 Tax=Falsiroseomonas ponticola TaxID=2786951 RepID=UPI0019334FB3|nr:acyclic terpene utilization AtuA family protein [Roseomonas ponticola]